VTFITTNFIQNHL